MVQRKQARKKPKDSGGLAEGGLPGGQARGRGGGDHPGSRGGAQGGGGGGGGVPRASIPNYMRPTSSSGARAGREAAAAGPAAAPVPRKREPVRAKVVLAAAPRAGRATCSSAMRGPGAAAAHACAYAYCSFRGHAHAHAAAAPLQSFLASQRRLIKTQQSMKLKGASPFRRPGSRAGNGCFVEVYAGGGGAAAQTASSGVSCSDLSAEEMDAMVRRMEYVTFDHLSSSCGDDAEHRAKDSGGSCGSSDVISNGSLELSWTKRRGLKEKGTLVADHEDEDFGACKSDISEELDANHGGNIPDDCGGNALQESSVDGVSNALSGISFEDVSSDCADEATSLRKKVTIARRRKSQEGGDQMRPFKPKAPDFLPAVTGPEAEKVDLRHQMMSDRRNAEEWMVDYALRKAVKKLARAQKRKVEMLVQAFETVLPTVANEKNPVQQDDATLSNPLQACGE
ncbi:hypothetical protein ACP4OV_019460 [Aristida adscensionis]